VYRARVIKLPAVQCHRAAVTGDDKLPPWVFFSAGCRPKLTGSFLWSLDAPEEDFPGAPAAFKEFIKAIKNGELIANGEHPATGVRHDLHPAEWTREALILDVRNGDLFEGHWIEHVRPSSNGESIERRNTWHLRWSSITLRAAIPEQKPGRIDWDDWWKHEIARRQQNLLPNEKDYLRKAEPLMMDRYGAPTVPSSELRRTKAALYRGDLERPKRTRPKHKG
jgi:hypothetical protein